jgi:L-arabinose isomerase
MREVAVTEGDKVAAQMRFGFAVDGYGVGDLVARMRDAPDAAVDDLVAAYGDSTRWPPSCGRAASATPSLRDGARQELGLRSFLEDGGFKGFTTTFEDLHGLEQLPGLAVQRLMADGYGFGGEGDWKTAALLRAMKVMGDGLPGGTSFMEDYTYHLGPTARSCSARTCSRSAPRSPRAGRRSRSTRSASAARATRSGWSSTPRPGPPSTSRSSTSASASA